ncbi:MAG: hypothetical protein LBV46_02475 [Bacteroidales bacterium]|jgi:hypothetical protein|nr:hypothetical protein [Bacteroidales bacterium]
MPFIDEVLKQKSISIVGMEKNTGKTECLNYLLSRLNRLHKKIAVTSIGIDGERVDQVTFTPKPEIYLEKGNLFVTSELFYGQKSLVSEILETTESIGMNGKMITARVIVSGKVILAGPTNCTSMKQLIDHLPQLGAEIVLIDGATSRKSLGSPSLSESMILTTGAAISPGINVLVSKTVFTYQLINLPKYETPFFDTLIEKEQGIWALQEDDVIDLQIQSALMLDNPTQKLTAHSSTLFVSGMVTDKLLNHLRIHKEAVNTTVVVKDFTKLFITPKVYHSFMQSGGKIEVLLKTRLIAVCANPTSPQGYLLNSEQLCNELSQALGVPVFDVKKER